jgi:hypothetical protein
MAVRLTSVQRTLTDGVAVAGQGGGQQVLSIFFFLISTCFGRIGESGPMTWRLSIVSVSRSEASERRLGNDRLSNSQRVKVFHETGV